MKQSTDSHGAARPVDVAARAVAVPEVGGAAAADAVELLRTLELVPGIEPVAVDAESDVGLVVSQDPPAGSDARIGDVVVLVVGQRREEAVATDEPPVAPDIADDEWFADIADSSIASDEDSASVEHPPSDAVTAEGAPKEHADTVSSPAESEDICSRERQTAVTRVLGSARRRWAVTGLAVLLAFVAGRTVGNGSPTMTTQQAATPTTPSPPSSPTTLTQPVSPRRTNQARAPRRRQPSRPPPLSQQRSTNAAHPPRTAARTPSAVARPQPPPAAAPSQPAGSRPHCEFCFENP